MKENFLDFLSTNNILNTAVIIGEIALFYIFILSIAVIFWTYRDIKNRSNKISIKLLSLFLVSFFNIFGLLIYLIIRPSKTLTEKSIENMELEILEKYKREKDEMRKSKLRDKIIKNKKRLIAKKR